MSQEKRGDSLESALAAGKSPTQLADIDPDSVTPVDVNTQLYLRLLGLLKISRMTAAEIVDVALRVTATAIENALLMNTAGRVTPEMIEQEIGREVKKRHTSMLLGIHEDETEEEMIARMRLSKQKGTLTYIDDEDDVETRLGPKLLNTLETILSPPKEPTVAIPEALRAARDSVSGGEMAMPLPVDAVHRMIGSFMQKYGLKKQETAKGVPPAVYCRYCSALVNLKEREKGIFCCEDAKRLSDICKEWKQKVLSVSGAAGKGEDMDGDEERKLGPKLVNILNTILSGPKELSLAIPEALKAAQERVSGGEMAMPLPVQVVHTMIANFMQKYGLKKHIISKGAEPVLNCRYCGAVVNLKEQEKGTFCCEAAKRLNDICQEWKRRVLSGSGREGFTDAQRVTRKRSDLPDKIRGAKAASAVKVTEQERMKLEKMRGADAVKEGRGKEATGKQLQEDELVPRREGSKARQGKQQQKQMQEARDEIDEIPKKGDRKMASKILRGSTTDDLVIPKKGDRKIASKILRGSTTDDLVLGKRGQKGDAKETGYEMGYDESKGGKGKDEAGYDDMYKSKDARGKIAAGEGRRSKIDQLTLEKDASKVKVKEKERMKQEDIKVAGKDVDDRQIGRGKEQRGAAQSERDEQYYGAKDREKAQKAKQFGKYDEIPGKEKHKAESDLKQMSSERVLGVHEPRNYVSDEKTGGKLQRGQQERAEQASRKKDVNEQEGKKAKEPRGKVVTISEMDDAEFRTTTPDRRRGSLDMQDQGTRLKKSLKKETKESQEERYDSEGSQQSKKQKVKPSSSSDWQRRDKLGDLEEVSSPDDGRTNKGKSSKRDAAAKETVKKKQSRPGKELLYTEEDKMLEDQSLSEHGRKRKPTSVSEGPSKHGPNGRDAFEEPTGSRSVRESTPSDSSHRIGTSKSKGQAESLKHPQSRRKTSHLPHGVSDDLTVHDSQVTRETSKMAPRPLKERTESAFHGDSHQASTMRDSMSSAKTKGFSMAKAQPSILYRLSEQEFIDLGWTILPCKTDPHRLVTYQATGAKIPCFWVCRKDHTTVEGNQEKMLYKNGKTFAVFYPNGNVKIFYPNGKQAIIIKRDEKGCLVTIMSPGGKNEKGTYMQPVTVGTFDSLGHGVIYNDYGGVRLSYNQEGGTYYDTPHGRSVKWQWPISFAINFIKAHFSELCENTERNAETLLHIQDLLAAKDKKENKELRTAGGKELRKETSPAKETLGGSPGLKESSVEINGSPKKSPFKEQSVHSPEKRESYYTNLKESNKSKRRLQQEDTPSFTPLFMPSAVAACKMEEIQARAEKKRQNLLNKAMNAAASCTPMSIIVLKINSFLGFRLLDQTAISIQFTAQDRFVRLELGVQIDPMVEAQVNMVEPNLLTSCVPAQLLCIEKKRH